MHALWHLITKELRILSRDPHGLLVLFVMPAIFILVMSVALQDAFAPDEDTGPGRVQLVNPSTEPVTDRFREHLARRIQVIPAEDGIDPSQAADQVRLTLPPDFGDRLRRLVDGDAGEDPAPVVELRAGTSVDGRSLELVASSIRIAMGEALSDVEGEGEITALMDALSQHAVQVTRPGREPDDRPLSSVQQSVPAWLVFGMFFVVIPLSTVLIGERRQGTLARLRLVGIGPVRLLASRLPAYFLINQIQLLVMLAIGFWIVPAAGAEALSAPQSALALALVASATSIAAVGFALLVGVIARTHMQATTTGGVFNIVFAAAGGIMVPRFVMADSMDAVAWLSPMGWALDGFLAAFLRNDALSVIGTPIAGLIGFGLVCLGLATLILARRP